MNVSPGSSQAIPANTQEGMEIVSAVMAKNLQKQEGQMALKLLEPAAPAPSPNPAVGNHINLRV